MKIFGTVNDMLIEDKKYKGSQIHRMTPYMYTTSSSIHSHKLMDVSSQSFVQDNTSITTNTPVFRAIYDNNDSDKFVYPIIIIYNGIVHKKSNKISTINKSFLNGILDFKQREKYIVDGMEYISVESDYGLETSIIIYETAPRVQFRATLPPSPGGEFESFLQTMFSTQKLSSWYDSQLHLGPKVSDWLAKITQDGIIGLGFFLSGGLIFMASADEGIIGYLAFDVGTLLQVIGISMFSSGVTGPAQKYLSPGDWIKSAFGLSDSSSLVNLIKNKIDPSSPTPTPIPSPSRTPSPTQPPPTLT